MAPQPPPRGGTPPWPPSGFGSPPDPNAVRAAPLLGSGSIDLSLLSDTQLRDQVTPNPWRQHQRLAAGRPGEIGELSAAFAAAGGDLELSRTLSTEAQQLIGSSYVNNGQPVYTVTDHIGRLPTNFPDAGTHLVELARKLDGVADDLQRRTLDAAATVGSHEADMQRMRADWKAEVSGATAATGLIPFARIAELQARRDALIADQQTRTKTSGGTVEASVGEYETTLNGVMRLLADVGYLPPHSLDAGPGDIDFDAAGGTGAADGVTDALTGGPNGLTDRIDGASAGVALLNRKFAAGAVPTPGETAYLQAFYDRLASSGTFSRLEGAVEPLAVSDPRAAPAVNQTLGTVANGLMNLSQVDGGGHVPASVHGLLGQRLGGSGYAAFDGKPIRTRERTPEGWVIPGQAEFEGTAGLIGHATVDGGREFTRELADSALRAKQDLDSAASGSPQLQATIDKAPNDLLGVVARDVEVSQDVVGDTDARHTLLGAGWHDGSGAAAVLHTATAPAQDTPEHATRSAELSRTIFTELGDDPPSWREVIPKGSDVSDAITELAASRVDTFAYPSGSTDLVQAPHRNPDGSWTADVRLDSGGRAPGDDRKDFLKFLATGGDLDSPTGDPDVQRMRAAADDHVVHQLAEALRTGAGPTTPLRDAGTLDGLITRSQYEALLDQGATQDAAAAKAHADRTLAVRMVERVLAVPASNVLPSPLNSQVKDPFNVAFDTVLGGLDPAPQPQAGARVADLFDQANQDYLNHRSYLVVAAKHEAGLLVPAEHPALFTPDGTLRSFDDMSHGPGDPVGELLDTAAAAPPGTRDWASALDESGQVRAGYDPLTYRAQDDPDTPVDDPGFRARLQIGSP